MPLEAPVIKASGVLDFNFMGLRQAATCHAPNP